MKKIFTKVPGAFFLEHGPAQKLAGSYYYVSDSLQSTVFSTFLLQNNLWHFRVWSTRF